MLRMFPAHWTFQAYNPNCLSSFRAFFIRDYAAHVPSALDIPSIEPVNALQFLDFLFGIMLRMFPAHWAFQA